MKKAIVVAALFLVAALVIGGIGLSKQAAAAKPEIKSCASCGGACTAESNCGSTSCKAVTSGTCGCGK